MKTINIQRSQIAGPILLVFAVLLSLLIAMIRLEHGFWLAAQLLVIIPLYWGWRNTAGLGVTLRLVFDGAWWIETGTAQRQPLVSIRSGWVCPPLVTAELRGTTGYHRLVVPFDAVSSREHWELRRLLIDGIPSSAGKK